MQGNQDYMEDFIKRLEPLKELHLPQDSYLIWGSGPLAIRGLRKARDIDLVVTPKLWEELTKRYQPEGAKKNKIVIGDIEIWADILNLTDRLERVIADRNDIAGYPFMKLSYTLEWKKFWNSEKSSEDIALIEAYLSERCDAMIT